MTDTGQVPGEGLPENAGMVEQPGASAHGAYTYLSDNPAEEEEDLLLPGAQGAWGNEVAPPAPEPVVETVHQPGPHELSGRDSGSVDLGGVRLPDPPPIPPVTPRRPLHLGPPLPDSSASPVRSLADRGPADVPVRQPATPSSGPEYLDAPRAPEAPAAPPAPWGAQPAPAPQVSAGAAPAETVIPGAEPMGTAQAVATRVAGEAEQAVPAQNAEAAQTAWAGHAVPVQTPEAVPAQASANGQAVPAQAPEAAPEAPAQAPAHVEGHGEPEGEPAAVAGPGEAQMPTAAEPGVAQAAPAAAEHDGPGAPAAGEPVGVESDTSETAPAEAEAEAEAVTAPAPAAEAPADGGEAHPAPAVAEQAVVPADVPETGPAPQAAPSPEAAAAPEQDAPVTAPQAVAEGAEGAAQVQAPEGTDVAAEAEAATPEAPAQAPDPAAAAPAVPVPDAAAPEPAALAAAVEAADPEARAPEVTAPEAEAPAPAATTAEPSAPQPEATGTETAAPAPPQETAPAATEVPASAPTEAPAPAAVEGPEPTTEAPAPAPTEAPAPQPEAPAPQPEVAPQPAPAAPTAPDDAADAPAAEPLTPAAGAPVTEPVASQAEATAPETPTSAPQSEASAPQAEAPAPQTEAPAPPVPTPDAAAPTPAPAPAPEPPVTTPTPEPPVTTPTPSAGATVPEPNPQDVAPGSAEDVTVVLPGEGAQEHSGQAQARPVQGPQQSRPAEPGAPAPAEPVAQVPAPRGEGGDDGDGDAVLVQNADDLDTRAAEQEDLADQERHEAESAAAVSEARQPTGPAAPAYDPAEREAVLKVMRERRDIRNGFRSDPIPHEVLLRVLEAAHHAPSVGHSQPWDFVVIRSADTRRAMHELAMRQRDAYAKSLPKGRAKQFKELKIEAILDTPVNIVVTADPTRGGRHTLGRHTQPQMAPYSAALAVENLWLAARAEGLGVGWVSFFDEREMVRALGLPEHLEVIAYLCVGYVDEFPDEPELLQAGWSKRRPLSWVVHEETYGRRALPGEEPHDLLAETVAQIRPLDAKALGEAWERQKRMTKPAGALGMLEIISAQLSGLSRQCPPPIPEPAAVAIFAGDHGVHAQGVTPWPQEVTAQMVANFLGGGAVCNAFATQVGAEICIVDVGVAADLPATPGLLPRKIRAGTSDMTTGPAMTREEAKQAIEVGIETARDLVAAGNKALLTGEMGIGNTTASAALIAAFTGADPAEVTGRGTGINDETLARKTEVVRRALELHQPDPADPVGVLAAIGGFEHAALVGLLLGGASLRTPVILDGVSAGAAALAARAIAPEVLAACIAGHRSAEPGHVAALNKLGLRPLVDLDLRLGEGTGALLALPLVQSTARAMHEVATFDSAGVTEK